jgi:hypothetical protein
VEHSKHLYVLLSYAKVDSIGERVQQGASQIVVNERELQRISLNSFEYLVDSVKERHAQSRLVVVVPACCFIKVGFRQWTDDELAHSNA